MKTRSGSSLRGVCTLYEARKAEFSVAGLTSWGRLNLKPAYGAAQSASISRRGQRTRRLALPLLAALLASQGASASDWGTSGSFDRGEADQIRRQLADNPPENRNRWGAPVSSSEWVALDKFERGKAGNSPPALASFTLPAGKKPDQLFALIAFAEAPQSGYDAIHLSAKDLPGEKPTGLTLAEIYQWIGRTPGQHHAIGRYQIIPSTLLNLQKRLGLPETTRFSRKTQDRMAAHLVADAGYRELISGELKLGTFMDNLARIWAGLPVASGKSYYDGYAGNRATITRAFFEKQMRSIFTSSRSTSAGAKAGGSSSSGLSSSWSKAGG